MVPPRRGGHNSRGNFGRGRSRGDPIGGRQRGQNPCRHFQQTGECPFGDRCRYSHTFLNSRSDTTREFRDNSEENAEQQQAKADYNVWRRLIKSPPRTNDINTMRSLWAKALVILEGSDLDWKLMLPRDLDDEQYYGRDHIRALMSMVANSGGFTEFIEIARPFLLVITHSSLLDCLSVDTAVGGLYNFISGSNGSRAIPFFHRLTASLAEQYSASETLATKELLGSTLVAASIAMRE
ncbi:hypothetical protein ACLMJK_003687 [Lecanora helva]